jgi:ABC-2 type transport system permease protein
LKLLRITLKDLRIILRDRWAVVSLIIVPVIIILVVAETQSGEGSSSILFPVVNEDQGPVANQLIRTLDEHLDVRVVDRETAERWVAKENRSPALLVLPEGLSKRYLTERATTIELLTDPASWMELQAIKIVLLLADRDASSLGDPFYEELLEIEERSLTGSWLKFTSLEQNIPGFAMTFVLLNMIFGVAFGMRDEEAWGTHARLAVAPIGHATVVAGKLLARLIVGTAQLLLLLFFGHVVYGLALGSSIPTLILAATVIVFSMTTFSLIIAAAARTREQVVPVGISALFILAALGGCWWPFFEQPAWMQTVAHGVLTSWSMFTIHDVMLRNKEFLDILPKLLFLTGYGVVSFLIGMRLFRYAEK